jgi:hypothetical protein
VRIYNLAEAPAKEIVQARDEAAQIFKHAGIDRKPAEYQQELS